MKLSGAMQTLVREQRLGFVATNNGDGTPNLSLKGTFEVLDEVHLMFLDIRSPNTTTNIRNGSAVEVNFVDPFVWKGFRFFGRAEVLLASSEEARDLVSRTADSHQRREAYRAL